MNSDTPITPDDPRLTAFALGELDGAVRDAVAAAVAADPVLQLAVEQLRTDLSRLRTQLRAAESGQLEFSGLLAAQVQERLEREASARGLDDAIASRALSGMGSSGHETAVPADGASGLSATVSASADMADASAVGLDGSEYGSTGAADGATGFAYADAVPSAAHAGRLRGAAAADWRDGLGRDARRRVVWWSPFALPFAASFVAVASVGLLWWNGYTPQRPEAEFSRDTAPAQMRLMRADSVPEVAVAYSSVAAARLPAESEGRNAAAKVVAGRQRAAPAVGHHVVAQSAARSNGKGAPTSAATDLFAPRVWAYLPSGAAVRESALPGQGGPHYTLAENTLLAAVPLVQEQAASAGDLSGVAVADHVRPVAAGDVAATALPGSSQSGSLAYAPGDSSWYSTDAALPAAVPVSRMSATVEQPAAAKTLPAAERSAQVLAEAATLVRPVAADAGGVNGLDATASARSPVAPLAAAAPVQVVTLVPAASVHAAGGATAGVTEPPADLDADTGGGTAAESANLTTAQIAAIAAAKHFSQASLEELETAAFAAGGSVWRAGSDEIVAAATQVAKAEGAGAVEGTVAPQDAPAAAPPVARQDLSSRYVQMKLWAEAGQLPPPSAIDVDAIVRDAVPVYAATALRQLRVQLARAAAAADGSGAVTEAGAAQHGEAISPKELELLESRSLMLRLVRSYAIILKDRPVDAVLQLDALTEQLKQRPRMANGRYGQEFLKLLEATRPLL